MEATLVQFLLLYITFLAMFSPPATMAAAATILGGVSNKVLRRVALRVSLAYVVVMLIVIWLGNYMLTALGLSTHALSATGGAALLFQGWPLMTRGTKADQSNAVLNSDSPKNADDLAVVPLLFPISIGGGTIAVGISSAAHNDTFAGMMLLSAVILAMAPTIALTFLISGPLHGRLSTGAMDTIARISGIILVALSLQLLVSGLTGLVTSALHGTVVKTL
ncbi:transporter [Serratia fonticola]|uniref:MarC family protein n=1 Tax=Serratia fonticola TaxID=47917 RepID=UPI0008FD62BC|nr:MarC family protein [Serratia fonticola]MBC3249779.1 MarC family protein [Serratia fonticola]OIX85294.1 transporter [Serratia fonticola]QCR62534.1 MarC family protein [Serratia fonticola]